jgi:PKD repeat protein/predicted secreted protein
MKKRLLFQTFAIILTFSVHGQNFVEITKSNYGQTINLTTNQVLEVKLPCNPSSGYGWYATSVDVGKGAIIQQIGDWEFVPDPNSGKVGQSGTQITRFIGGSQGSAEITMEYKRSWEKGNEAIDNYAVTIVSSGKYTGNYIPVKPQSTENHKFSPTPKSLPSSFSWQSQCTPVKDQGSCGSCWAFAGCGTFEANIKIIDNVTRDLSEQWLVNCATDMSGCSGGLCPHHYWQSPGAVYENQEPYTAMDGACDPSYTYNETINSYHNYGTSPTDAQIKQAIYDYGPVWAAVYVGSSFQNYTGGIFTSGGSGQINHAIVLVGWDDTNGYWILRNSWGAGWGESGYMRIGYGVGQVGAYANHIVYKGGMPHNAPPVANFAALSIAACTGIIQFVDSSANNPTSWSWNFGDGGTSSLQNPSHQYAASGTYTVKLTVTNTYGNNLLTKTNFVTISIAAAPITTGALSNGPGSVTLSASGSGTLNWYNSPSGGSIIHTGTTYTTPVLSATTTYYVQSEMPQPIQSVGRSDNSGSGGYYINTETRALIFDALIPIKLISVTVYASSTANRTIWLKNSSGTILDSAVINISTGQQSITLNFDVPAGTGFQLGTYGQNHLFRNTAGGVYPFTIPNIISITGNTASISSAGEYYFFYNWQIQEPCLSAMTPVTATIYSTGINENQVSDFGIFPNPNTGTFEIKLNKLNFQNATVSMINMFGELLLGKNISNNIPAKFDASDFPRGMYYIKVETENSIYLKKVIITK